MNLLKKVFFLQTSSNIIYAAKLRDFKLDSFDFLFKF